MTVGSRHHDVVGAVGGDSFDLGGRTRLPPHLGAGELGELDRHRADAATGAEDQHAVERTDERTVVQRLPCGDAGDGHSRGLRQIDAIRQCRQPHLGHGDAFAVQALADDTQAATADEHRTAVGGVPRGLGARYPRQVRLGGTDGTLSDPHVERIHRCVRDLHELITIAGLRVGDLVELQGAPDGMKSSCAHRATVGRKFAPLSSG